MQPALNAAKDPKHGPFPGLPDDGRFSEYLGALFGCPRESFDRTLAELLGLADEGGDVLFRIWLDRFEAGLDSPLLRKGGGDASGRLLIATLPLFPGVTPVHVEPHRISSCHGKEPLTPATALAMATLAKMNPAMKDGVEVSGDEEERLLLAAALETLGIKVLNPPPAPAKPDARREEIRQAVARAWNGYARGMSTGTAHRDGAPGLDAGNPEKEEKDRTASSDFGQAAAGAQAEGRKKSGPESGAETRPPAPSRPAPSRPAPAAPAA